MSGQRHPDTETLASLRTGLVGGFRGKRLAAHVARCARCAAVCDELAAVSSFLASAPVPPLPVSLEHQITGALAAEAAARAARAAQVARAAQESADAVPGTGPAVLSPVGADPGGAAGHDSADRDSADRIPAPRRGTDAWRHRVRADRFRPAMAFVPVVACLLLAGFGYLLSSAGQSSGPPGLGPAAAPATVPGTTPSASSSSTPSSPLAPQIRNAPASSGKKARTPPATAGPGAFRVIASGTLYQAATLREQVSAELDTISAYATPTQSVASAPTVNPASSDNGGGFFSSAALTQCVFHLTNNVTPSLVDEASYQGEPVFVIALPDWVWVVGRGCTASNPQLVVSAALSAP
jgi:hypothetical protein